MSLNRRQRSFDVLLSDAHLVVATKPSGIPVSGDRAGVVSLSRMLHDQLGIDPADPLRNAYRLAEDASGVVVFARSRTIQQQLSSQLADGRAQITYLALVTGHIESDGRIDLPLYYHKRLGKLQVSSRRGEQAVTRYRVVERMVGNTLLECQLGHDRTDQLRIHLEAIGHPLTVDPGFGGGNAVLLSEYKSGYRSSGRRSERPLIDRLTLHASSVRFSHPATGEELEFSAALPKDLRATLTQLVRLL